MIIEPLLEDGTEQIPGDILQWLVPVASTEIGVRELIERCFSTQGRMRREQAAIEVRREFARWRPWQAWMGGEWMRGLRGEGGRPSVVIGGALRRLGV